MIPECGGNMECNYDATVTGDVSLGLNNLRRARREAELVLADIELMIDSCPQSVSVLHGVVIVHYYNTTGEVVYKLDCHVGFILNGSDHVTCLNGTFPSLGTCLQAPSTTSTSTVKSRTERLLSKSSFSEGETFTTVYYPSEETLTTDNQSEGKFITDNQSEKKLTSDNLAKEKFTTDNQSKEIFATSNLSEETLTTDNQSQERFTTDNQVKGDSQINSPVLQSAPNHFSVDKKLPTSNKISMELKYSASGKDPIFSALPMIMTTVLFSFIY
jgi:hypothetical protein